MLIYIIFIITSLTLLYIPIKSINKQKNIYNTYPFSFIAYILIVCFSGFRYGIGTDYFNYQNIFFNINADNVYNSNLELGFYFIAKLLPQNASGFYALIFITSFITNFIFYLSLKNNIVNCNANHRNSYRMLVILFFFLSSVYFIPFNGIRQGIAFSCVLLAFNFIIKRNPISFLLCILFGFLFHKSILLFIPFYYLYKIKINLKINLFLIVASCLLIQSSILSSNLGIILSLLDDKYSKYILESRDYGGSGLGIYLYVVLFIFIYISTYFIKNKIKHDMYFNFLFFIFSIGITLRILSLENILFSRPSYYFTVFDVIFIPYFILLFEKTKNRIIISSFIMLVFITNLIASLLSSNGLMPYDSILFN